MTKEISIPQKPESLPSPSPPQNMDNGIPNSTLVPTMGGAILGALSRGLPGALFGGLAGFAISKKVMNGAHKGHDARAIANLFVRKSHQSGPRLTILPLVKYVYFAHGWTLGYTGLPLIRDDVRAWKYGPVVPKVYEAFRPQGLIIREEAKGIFGAPYETEITDDERGIIDSVYDHYSALTPYRISRITHAPSSPWIKYRNQYYAKIPNEEIEAYYKDIIKGRKNNG